MRVSQVAISSPLVGSLVLVALAAAKCGGSTGSTSIAGPSGSRCEVSISHNTSEVPAAGGNGSITINSARECSWSASVEAPWIRLSATGGQGPATVNYSVLPNPTYEPRRSRVVVAEHALDVTQAATPAPEPEPEPEPPPPAAPTPTPAPGPACSFVVSPLRLDAAAGGERVSIEVAGANGCTWNARSGAPWIAIASGATGTATGSVRVSVGSNAGSARTGTLTVAGHTVTIAQAAAASCSYRLPQTNRSVGREPEEFTVAVDATSGCGWTAASSDSWITVGDGGTGSGSGSFRLSAARNTGGPRTGTVRVATETFTVQQAAGACTYAIKPTYYNAGRGPDTILIDVTADNGCAWTTRTSADWVTVDAGRSGSGNGTVRLVIPANTAGARTAIVTIAGHEFTLRQEGLCTYTLKPRSYHAGRGPDDIRIAVTTDAGCAWSAASSVPWVTVAAGTTGSGSGTVRLLVQANSGSARSVTLTIAGEPFELRQDGTR
jgi:hypothetical protein